MAHHRRRRIRRRPCHRRRAHRTRRRRRPPQMFRHRTTSSRSPRAPAPPSARASSSPAARTSWTRSRRCGWLSSECPTARPCVDALRANAGVVRVERDAVRAAEAAPSDPSTTPSGRCRTIGWDQVYGTVHPTGSAVVAVLDTGVDAGHADLAGQLVPGTSILAGGDPTRRPQRPRHGDGRDHRRRHGQRPRVSPGIGFAGVKVMPVTVLDADGTRPGQRHHRGRRSGRSTTART